MPYPSKLSPETIEDAAWQLYTTGGEPALNMRSLADTLGVRPGSLYRHIGNRETLLDTLAERAAHDLQRDLNRAADSHEPRPALQAAAAAYLHYARTQPHAYSLLLTPPTDTRPTQPSTGQPDTSAGKALWNTILHLVGQLSGQPDDTDHAVALWTFLHGFATLERSGLFGPSGPRGGLHVGLNALFDAMQRPTTPH